MIEDNVPAKLKHLARSSMAAQSSMASRAPGTVLSGFVLDPRAVALTLRFIDRERRMIGNLVIEIEPAEPPIS
jgi:hypothetical protein